MKQNNYVNASRWLKFEICVTSQLDTSLSLFLTFLLLHVSIVLEVYLNHWLLEFTGFHFLSELSSDFDLHFDRTKGRGTSIVEMRQELRAFTVAFWLKVSEDEVNPGTPISYAASLGGGSNF